MHSERRCCYDSILAASGTTGQGVVLTGDVQVDEEYLPAEKKQEAKNDTTLDRPKDSEATSVTSKSLRVNGRGAFSPPSGETRSVCYPEWLLPTRLKSAVFYLTVDT